jgi:hypothetical protein
MKWKAGAENISSAWLMRKDSFYRSSVYDALIVVSEEIQDG